MALLVILGIIFLMLIIGSLMTGFVFNIIGAFMDLSMLIGIVIIGLAIFA